MSRTVPLGARGADFSFARPPGKRLVELGYLFGVGYLSVPPAAARKNLTAAECVDYLNYIFLLLVHEQTAARANLGAPAGAVDGANAKRMAGERGLPVDVPILVADDTNTTAQNVDAHEAYMRAFAKMCAPYPIGIYGDVDILYRCADLWVLGWLPNAWSWSGGSRQIAEATARALGVHVLQRTGYYIDQTWAVDPNDVIRPFPAWGLGTDPQPAPLEDDMLELITNTIYPNPGYSVWALLDDGSKRGVSPAEYRARGTRQPAVVADADLALIPDWQPTAAAQAPVIDYDALAAAIVPLVPTKFHATSTTEITAAG